MWALAWMPSWWGSGTTGSSTDSPDSGSGSGSDYISDASSLLSDAYASIYGSSQWVFSSSAPSSVPSSSFAASTQSDITKSSSSSFARTTPTTPTTPTAAAATRAHLHPGDQGNKLFPFSDAIATSFFPMIYKQLGSSSRSRKGSRKGSRSRRGHIAHEQDEEGDGEAARLQQVYAYFEWSFSRFFDSDGDGELDSFQYNTDLLPSCGSMDGTSTCPTGDYSIWATANMLIGMLLPPPAPVAATATAASAASAAVEYATVHSDGRQFMQQLFGGKDLLFLKQKEKPKVVLIF
jgi:hypothetical protein